jgi:hypothetical protein
VEPASPDPLRWWDWPGNFDEPFGDSEVRGWRNRPVGRRNKGPKCYDPSRRCGKAHEGYTPERPWGVIVCSLEKHGRLKEAGALGNQIMKVQYRTQQGMRRRRFL